MWARGSSEAGVNRYSLKRRFCWVLDHFTGGLPRPGHAGHLRFVSFGRVALPSFARLALRETVIGMCRLAINMASAVPGNS